MLPVLVYSKCYWKSLNEKKMQTALYLFLMLQIQLFIETNTINRDYVKLIQTPQLSKHKT